LVIDETSLLLHKILRRLSWAGFASGDHPHSLASLAVHDHENASKCIHTQGNKSLFATCIRIFDGDGGRVA